MTSIPIEDEVAPCPACSRLVALATLCGCEVEGGPLCPVCCEHWHQDERRAA